MPSWRTAGPTLQPLLGEGRGAAGHWPLNLGVQPCVTYLPDQELDKAAGSARPYWWASQEPDWDTQGSSPTQLVHLTLRRHFLPEQGDLKFKIKRGSTTWLQS